MSIVTLKKKANTLYGTHGVEKFGFSLNGKLRFPGPTRNSFGRTPVRTPFRGTEPIGFGGGGRCRVGGIKGRSAHCDKVNGYPKSVHTSCGMCSTNSIPTSNASVNSTTLLSNISRGCFSVQPLGLDGSDLQIPRCNIVEQPSGTCDTYVKEEGPLSYDMFQWYKKGKTKFCAVPQWPPRVNNGNCSPVWRSSP